MQAGLIRPSTSQSDRPPLENAGGTNQTVHLSSTSLVHLSPPLENAGGTNQTVHLSIRPSTSPTQSLSLLNSDFTRQQALALAAASLRGDETAIAEAIFRATLARRPDANELDLARQFLTKQTQLLGSVDKAAAELARGLFNTNEFLYVD
jgi:hypothetical protein